MIGMAMRVFIPTSSQKADMTWNGEKILGELEAKGWTIYRIAEKLGRKWDTVNRWRSIEPRFSDAQAILKLHAEVSRETLP